jgi:hypothetical protein
MLHPHKDVAESPQYLSLLTLYPDTGLLAQTTAAYTFDQVA